MTRIVVRDATGPQAIKKEEIAGDAVYVCRCGLSRSQPFCDGSHKMTRDEVPEVLVRYVERDGQRVREPVRLEPAEATAPHTG